MWSHCSRTIGIFYKIRHCVPCEILKTLYYSLFYSFVSYGIAVWGFTYISHIQKLSFLQKKIIRVMAFKNKQNTPILFSQNLNFSRLRIFVNCNYFHLYLIVKTKLHQFTFMIILFSVLKFTTLIQDWLHVVIFFWRGKIPFNMVLGQLNTTVLGFGTCSCKS